MWTIQFRGYWIHGYVDRPECRIQGPDYRIIAKRPCLDAACRFILDRAPGGQSVDAGREPRP
jgi:hypothetical protein